MEKSENSSLEPGKMFIGGLSWETTEENLKKYFEKFGTVTDVVIMMDLVTKRPRGFGFVTFSDPNSVEEVMKQAPHVLDNKTIDPKPATTKTSLPPAQGSGGGSFSGRAKKIFVGGIAAGTTEDDVRRFFSEYGNVTEIDLKYDKNTQRMRGFGFVGFESEDVVDRLCQIHFHSLNGKTIEVKKAEPRFTYGSGSGGAPSYGTQRHGGGGGGGGYQHGGYDQSYSRGGDYGGGYNSGYGGYGYPPPSHGQQQPYGSGYGYGSYGPPGGGYGQYSHGAYPGYDRTVAGAQQQAPLGDQPRTYSATSPYYASGGTQQPSLYQQDTRPPTYGQNYSYNYSAGTTTYTAPAGTDASSVDGYGRGTAVALGTPRAAATYSSYPPPR